MVERLGEFTSGAPRQAIPNITRILAESIKGTLEIVCADNLREIAHNSAVKTLVMRGDVEVPLIVRQALARLDDDNPFDIVRRGDRFMIRREVIAVESLVVRLDPSDAFGTFRSYKCTWQSMIGIVEFSSAASAEQRRFINKTNDKQRSMGYRSLGGAGISLTV